MAVGPLESVHFGQVLDEILVGGERAGDFPQVNDDGSSEFTPHRLDDAMRDEAGANKEVVVRPSGTGNLRHTEVLNFPEAFSELSDEDRDFAAGSFPGVAGSFPKGRINCEGEEAIRLSQLHGTGKSFDLRFSTQTAGPSSTGQDEHDVGTMCGGIGGQRLGIGTDSEVRENGLGLGPDEKGRKGLPGGLD